MSITDYQTYLRRVVAPHQRLHVTKNSVTGITGRWSSMWDIAPFGGTNPGASAVPTNATAGAIGQANGGASALRIHQLEVVFANGGALMLVDRLVHTGGLDGTLATPQTTNLPTSALTRETTGAGVHMGLEIYTAIGASSTTVTASYTNQAGSSGRTTQATAIGNTGFSEDNRFIMLPMQQGDTGVRAVASVTLAATTGTAGAFGVVLYKPLLMVPVLAYGSPQRLYDALLDMANMPEVVDNAALSWMVCPQAGVSGVLTASISMLED